VRAEAAFGESDEPRQNEVDGEVDSARDDEDLDRAIVSEMIFAATPVISIRVMMEASEVALPWRSFRCRNPAGPDEWRAGARRV